MTDPSSKPNVQILIDGDACPVKDEIYKVALRHTIPVMLVANSWIRMPDHPLFSFRLVNDEFDAADNFVAEHATSQTIAITSDIPLADRCLKAGATVLSPRGKAFTEDSIGSQLATRAIMVDLRAGVGNEQIGGQAPFTKVDRSNFLQALDTAIVKMKRQYT